MQVRVSRCPWLSALVIDMAKGKGGVFIHAGRYEEETVFSYLNQHIKTLGNYKQTRQGTSIVQRFVVAQPGPILHIY